MAKFETSAGIEDMTGKLGKKSVLTMRRKKWRYPDGRIFGYGPKEIYSQDVRDYKRKPRTAAEEVQHKKWTFVCQEASRITKDPSHPRYSEMVMRHAAQLKGISFFIYNWLIHLCVFLLYIGVLISRNPVTEYCIEVSFSDTISIVST